jgi:hypothetical protein
MGDKGEILVCPNKNCSLYNKHLPCVGDVAFIFCPRCTRKLFKNNSSNNNVHNNNNKVKNKNFSADLNKNNGNPKYNSRKFCGQYDNNDNNENKPQTIDESKYNTMNQGGVDSTIMFRILEKMLDTIGATAK